MLRVNKIKDVIFLGNYFSTGLFSLAMSLIPIIFQDDNLYFNPWLGDSINLSLIFFYSSCYWLFFWIVFGLIQTSSNWVGDRVRIMMHFFVSLLAMLFIVAPDEFILVIYFICQDSQYTVLFIKTIANFLIIVVLFIFFDYCLTIQKRKNF